MYTRNYGHSEGRGERGQRGRDMTQNDLLIPREYHGEMLRPRPAKERASVPAPAPAAPVSAKEPTGYAEESPTHTFMPASAGMPETGLPETVPWERTGNISPTVPASAPFSGTESSSGGNLLDGVFDLLLGKNSDEEETILLLGIAVLLLSGHMERRKDGEHGWGEDDIGLLLVGYLLLG